MLFILQKSCQNGKIAEAAIMLKVEALFTNHGQRIALGCKKSSISIVTGFWRRKAAPLARTLRF
jgi:hypothetical protein